MKKLIVKFGGIGALVGLISVLLVLPAQASGEYVELVDVSCNSTTDTMYATLIGDEGDTSDGVMELYILHYQSGVEYKIYAPIDGTLELPISNTFPQDMEPGDTLTMILSLRQNGIGQVYAIDSAEVDCAGPDDFTIELPGRDPDPDPRPIGNIVLKTDDDDDGGQPLRLTR